jgi:hypothetical protein
VTEYNRPIIDKGIDRRSLAEQLLSPPCEETLYQSHFKCDFSSLEEFCALMSGISPERFEEIIKNEKEDFTKLDIKRCLDAHKLYKRFLRHLDEDGIFEKI